MDDNISYRGGTATKQAVEGRDERGRFARGNTPKVGFHTHPERRSNGSWKKEATPRAKLEKLFSDVTLGEFLAQINEHNIASNFSEEVGNVLISERLANTFTIDANGKIKINSKELDSLLYFVYGKKIESDVSISAKDNLPEIPQFAIPTLPQGYVEEQRVISEEHPAK
ncbi:hypothetical protein GX865_01830 [Candidatus Saccharibacteria bacterium]|jgi:hypothetical protein|nr:hypothetical protein [Candidatus Saccharibacteria bacterium]